jgi:NAD(P)-dependent dehydrogenase (short-subunit alcohol dehydrogenase family)
MMTRQARPSTVIMGFGTRMILEVVPALVGSGVVESVFAPNALEGRRAVVAGGTRGIGAATVRMLAATGARVVAAARSKPGELPDGVDFVAADLASERGPADLAATSLAILGGVDIVVSTSGGQTRRPGGALGLGDDGYFADFESNLLAAVRLDRALVPGMIEQGSGAIVHVGSGAARNVRRHPLGYAAAKAALTAYSKGLAAELGPHGIRVNIVQPGMIHTERMDERLAELAAASGQDPGAALRAMLDHYDVPLGRVGTPDEVAAAIVFLVSAAGGYVTGAQLVVDGGLIPTT